MKLIAANLAKSNYHQNFYDQSLGPSVGRVVNDVTAEIAGGSMSPQEAAKAIEAAERAAACDAGLDKPAARWSRITRAAAMS